MRAKVHCILSRDHVITSLLNVQRKRTTYLFNLIAVFCNLARAQSHISLYFAKAMVKNNVGDFICSYEKSSNIFCSLWKITVKVINGKHCVYIYVYVGITKWVIDMQYFWVVDVPVL